MKALITITAPTVHNLKAANSFNIPVKEKMSGKIEGKQEFETIEAALAHLKTAAKNIFNKWQNENYEEMILNIEKYNTLSFDGARAEIELL